MFKVFLCITLQTQRSMSLFNLFYIYISFTYSIYYYLSTFFFYFLYNLTSLSKNRGVTYNVINFYLPILFTNQLSTYFFLILI